MRYTRMQHFWEKYNKKFKILMMFVIVLPIVAIAAGAVITKVLIIPYTNRNLQLSNSIKSQEAINAIDKYTIYYIQVGAFTSSENAKQLCNSLNNKGIPAANIFDKDIYRVIAGISTGNSFETVIDKLKVIGYDWIVKEYTISKLNGDDNNTIYINDYLANISILMKSQIEAAYKQERDIDDAESIKKELDNVNSGFKTIMSLKMEEKLIQNTNSCNDIINQSVQKYLADFKNRESSSELKILANEIFAVKSLYDYISQIYIN